MIRAYLNEIVQKKFFIMFFTCIIYILGLFAFFNNNPVLYAALLLILGVYAIWKNYFSPKLVVFWYLVFFVGFFNAGFRIKNTDALYFYAPKDVVIEGQVTSIPNDTGEKTKFFFQSSGIKSDEKFQKINAKTLVTVNNSRKSQFDIGNFYKISGKLRVPFDATNPSQFDYAKYLKNFGVYTVVYAESGDCSKSDVKLSLKWKFWQSLNNVRNRIIETHARYLKSPNLELLGGVVFGDDAISPPDSLKKSFANSGLLHVLAASGMNVALIYGIWFYILKKLRAPFNFTVASGIFVVIFYTLMTGLGASIVRAAVMLIFVLLGKLINRDADSLSLLSFVALLMLICNPASINDVSFQLSFVVTFGLLVTSPIIFSKVNWMPNLFSSSIFVPLIAQIWVAPIQMYYFNSFSLYSIFANILTIPFITLISFGGFISAVLALITPIADKVCFVFDLVLNPILNITVFISDFFSKLPHSLLEFPQPEVYQIFLYYAIVLMIILMLKNEVNKKIVSVITFLTIVLVFSCIKFPNHNLEVIAFDVKNADAFLLKTPDNKYFLIDSGKSSYKNGKSQAKYIILEYLKDRGIKNIEALIVTHFDSDHAGGAVDLMKKLNISKVYVNSLVDKSAIAKEIYKTGGKKVVCAKNNEIVERNGDFVIKNFVAGFKSNKLENENSIITLVSNGNSDILFMGDAGIMAFAKIQKYLPEKVEVLKVGHHGAKDVLDKAFLARIKPDYAIISTGVNSYGHPNPVTVNLLESARVKVLRTDEKNAIKLENDKKDFDFYSFDKKWVELAR